MTIALIGFGLTILTVELLTEGALRNGLALLAFLAYGLTLRRLDRRARVRGPEASSRK